MRQTTPGPPLTRRRKHKSDIAFLRAAYNFSNLLDSSGDTWLATLDIQMVPAYRAMM